MPFNLESKFGIQNGEDSLKLYSNLAFKLKDLTTHYTIKQEDTFFKTINNDTSKRVKLRRCFNDDRDAELISYDRPTVKGEKTSESCIVKVGSYSLMVQVLSSIAKLYGVLRKTREVFKIQYGSRKEEPKKQARIHIDNVEKLGNFIEFEVIYDGSEGGKKEASQTLSYLIDFFSLSSRDEVECSYFELLEKEKCEKPKDSTSSEVDSQFLEKLEHTYIQKNTTPDEKEEKI